MLPQYILSPRGCNNHLRGDMYACFTFLGSALLQNITDFLVNSIASASILTDIVGSRCA